MIVRKYDPRDTEQIAQLFHDTIHTVNLGNYTQEQVEAWAPAEIDYRRWGDICRNCCTFIAEEAGVILGFGDLEANGHIDHLFVHHLRQRQGVGNRIYAAIEAEARKLELPLLFTEASITARPFFTRMGYATMKEQTVTCRGQTFTNYVMEKRIFQDAPSCG